MKNTWFGTAVVAAALAAPLGVPAMAHAAPPANGWYVGQERSWDQPPDEYQDAQRRGWHEGIEAARRDYSRSRHKDADDHRMYKHPPVDRQDRDAFREGFRRGYSEAMNHMRDENHGHHHDDDDNHAPQQR